MQVMGWTASRRRPDGETAMHAPETMKPGTTVQFTQPSETEVGFRFEVLEDRDTRVLVRALTTFDGWSIAPTFVYLKSDLTVTR